VRNTPTEQKEVAENDSGQSLLHPVTLIGESHRNGERMKNAFWGVLGFSGAGLICPLLGGPKYMLFWTRKEKTNAI
jgi:hypothetical protein